MKAPESEAEKNRFRDLKNGWRSRINSLPHGSVQRAADAAHTTENTVSRWGASNYNGTPTIWDVERICREMNLSAAWLAFGLGPHDPAAATAGFALGKNLERDARLATVVAGYAAAPENGRQLLYLQAQQFAPTQPALPSPTHTEESEMPLRISPVPPARPRRVNRRDELPTFTIARTKKATGIPQWYNLAAGAGREMQRCEELLYLRELHKSRGYAAAKIAGHSMADTLLPGDTIVLQEFNESGISLEPLEHNALKNPLVYLKSEVPHDSICVLSINDDPPTLKRVVYDTHAGVNDWVISIVADNPLEWNGGQPFPVRRTDRVTFWARVVGLVHPS